jgi:hypothetical protein
MLLLVLTDHLLWWRSWQLLLVRMCYYHTSTRLTAGERCCLWRMRRGAVGQQDRGPVCAQI